MLKNVSLVIPCQNAESKMHQIFEHIPNWEKLPNEIIIIDSSNTKFVFSKSFETYAKKMDIKLLIFYEKKIFPGHARNIGINNSTNSILAFLDTGTHPSKKWLSSGIFIMNAKKSDGVWGNTYFQADMFFTQIIRACTYGTKPIRTFPGSIINKDVFKKCGLFVESARAGEDGEWMARCKLHNIDLSNPKEFLRYDELKKLSLLRLLKKWFRNYIYSARLPNHKVAKDYYFYFISFILILIAYNWNATAAAWDTASVYFIPNITKISLLITILFYIFIRGIVMPKKKGVNFGFIFPLNFLLISVLSLAIDLTKAMAFGYSRFYKKINIESNTF